MALAISAARGGGIVGIISLIIASWRRLESKHHRQRNVMAALGGLIGNIMQ